MTSRLAANNSTVKHSRVDTCSIAVHMMMMMIRHIQRLNMLFAQPNENVFGFAPKRRISATFTSSEWSKT